MRNPDYTYRQNVTDVKPVERSRNLSVNAFHEKAGRSQGNSGFIVSSWFFSLTKFLPRRVATVAMLPSALSRSDWFRSVHVGRSPFSRCCHLFGALWFWSPRVEPGPGLISSTDVPLLDLLRLRAYYSLNVKAAQRLRDMTPGAAWKGAS